MKQQSQKKSQTLILSFLINRPLKELINNSVSKWVFWVNTLCVQSVLMGSGYYNWLAMIGLDFYQDQENSLDILIKFQDEHQQPESHTHEELFLPIAEISVTSHPTAPLLSYARQPSIEEQSIADELIEKMRLACEEQEEKAWLLLGSMTAEKDGGSVNHKKMLQESPEGEKEGAVRQKRKIIRKKHAE